MVESIVCDTIQDYLLKHDVINTGLDKVTVVNPVL